MRNRLLAFVTLLLMIAQPYKACAQALADPNQLLRFTSSAFYAGIVNRALAVIPPTVFQRCPSLVSNGSTVTQIIPVTFGADGFPNSGLWHQRFPVSGCGNDTTLNLFFSVTPAEVVNAVIGAPGSTHADLVLERDALTYAKIGALTGALCKSAEIKDTKFENYGVRNPPIADPGPGSHLRPWWEIWTMVGCGDTIEVPLDFVPQLRGTQIIQPGGVTEY